MNSYGLDYDKAIKAKSDYHSQFVEYKKLRFGDEPLSEQDQRLADDAWNAMENQRSRYYRQADTHWDNTAAFDAYTRAGNELTAEIAALKKLKEAEEAFDKKFKEFYAKDFITKQKKQALDSGKPYNETQTLKDRDEAMKPGGAMEKELAQFHKETAANLIHDSRLKGISDPQAHYARLTLERSKQSAAQLDKKMADPALNDAVSAEQKFNDTFELLWKANRGITAEKPEQYPESGSSYYDMLKDRKKAVDAAFASNAFGYTPSDIHNPAKRAQIYNSLTANMMKNTPELHTKLEAYSKNWSDFTKAIEDAYNEKYHGAQAQSLKADGLIKELSSSEEAQRKKEFYDYYHSLIGTRQFGNFETLSLSDKEKRLAPAVAALQKEMDTAVAANQKAGDIMAAAKEKKDAETTVAVSRQENEATYKDRLSRVGMAVYEGKDSYGDKKIYVGKSFKEPGTYDAKEAAKDILNKVNDHSVAIANKLKMKLPKDWKLTHDDLKITGDKHTGYAYTIKPEALKRLENLRLLGLSPIAIKPEPGLSTAMNQALDERNKLKAAGVSGGTAPSTSPQAMNPVIARTPTRSEAHSVA